MLILEGSHWVRPLAVVEGPRIRVVHVSLTAEFSTRQSVLFYSPNKNKNEVTDTQKSRKFFLIEIPIGIIFLTESLWLGGAVGCDSSSGEDQG